MEYVLNVHNEKDGYLFNNTHDTLNEAQTAVYTLKRANYFLADNLKFHGNVIEISEKPIKSLSDLIVVEF